ncbi:MAG: glutathione S-transferase N-terminal domain-containing protein [Alphaproteobacteria bacterium]|jgi:glutathione S-transferase|nr:glutathione S-transferase [Rhodospirillaceae bacterium]MDG2480149.1 glutathione S-transferase N-terminal domain-containing protein [Alphaproteobacteria bacterium]MBT6205916.1 glutathione S-transferase [Rhodospirillaceae bacterium]MBT6511840.1 glutathione S-transferase [Rhodospirillaceae bacterium]MBT7611598.1 glutathione S-transferase [Rhodospirillaceae bacterium]
MKLYQSPSSPFARKVLVAAHERGIADQIEFALMAGIRNGELAADNPLAKVPSLVLDDGTAIYDSLVIVSYFDGLGAGPALIPSDPAARTTVLVRHALANGMMDAAVASVMETRRPDDKIWPDFIQDQHGKVTRGLDTLEGDVAAMGDDVDISTLSVACALGYIDFRLGDMGWRNGRPALAAWYEGFAKRPSMIGTVPSNPPSA